MVYFLVYLFALSSRLFCFYFCTFLRQSDKYGRKHSEYICLDESYQQFKRIHKDVEQYGSYRQCTVERRSQIPKNSMKGIIGTGTFSHQGTSGQKISFQ